MLSFSNLATDAPSHTCVRGCHEVAGSPLGQPAPPPLASVHPIQEEDLAEVCHFLHRHLNTALGVQRWREGLYPDWSSSVAPNHGFCLRHEEAVVGVLGAIYSRQWLNGTMVGVCNLTSWYVMEAFRSQGMGLLGRLLAQPGWHFTNFTASPALLPLFRMVGFRPLDDSLYVWPNLPHWPQPRVRVELRPQKSTPQHQQQLFMDHQQFGTMHWCWLGEETLVVYRRRSWRHLPLAEVLHVEGTMEPYWGVLANHLLTQGFPLARVAARLVETPPPLAVRRSDTQPRLWRAAGLEVPSVSLLYSELITLDL